MMTAPNVTPTRRARHARRRRHAFSPLTIGVLFAVGAGFLTALTPPEWRVADSFVSSGTVAEPVAGREIVVRVDEAHSTTHLTADGESFSGHWLAVRVTAAATVSEDGTAIALAKALIGDRVFHAATNVPDTMRGESLRVGSGTTGWFAFEIPADVDLDDVDVQFSPDAIPPLRDSIVEVRLGEVAPVDALDLTRPELTELP